MPSWKVTFPVTQKPNPSTVFNQQASDWVHCKNETGAYYQLSRFTYKLVIVFKNNIKVVNFARKKTRFSKNSLGSAARTLDCVVWSKGSAARTLDCVVWSTGSAARTLDGVVWSIGSDSWPCCVVYRVGCSDSWRCCVVYRLGLLTVLCCLQDQLLGFLTVLSGLHSTGSSGRPLDFVVRSTGSSARTLDSVVWSTDCFSCTGSAALLRCVVNMVGYSAKQEKLNNPSTHPIISQLHCHQLFPFNINTMWFV